MSVLEMNLARGWVEVGPEPHTNKEILLEVADMWHSAEVRLTPEQCIELSRALVRSAAEALGVTAGTPSG